MKGRAAARVATGTGRRDRHFEAAGQALQQLDQARHQQCENLRKRAMILPLGHRIAEAA